MSNPAPAADGGVGIGGEMSSAVDSAMDRMIGLPGASSADAFIPSSSWRGPREGYYFGTVDGKTGYYLDASGFDAKRAVRFSANEGEAMVKEEEEDGDAPPAAKRPKTERRTGEELLAEAESALKQRAEELGGSSARVLDLSRGGAAVVRSAALALERAASANRAAREKHPNEPEKFMESELALHDAAESLRDAAADPAAAYGPLVKSGAVDGLLGLLGHENADVAATGLGVLSEWLDPALLVASGGAAEAASNAVGLLARAVVDGGGLELAAANLVRLDEGVEEEAKAIDDALTLAENLLDIDLAGALVREGSPLGDDDSGNRKKKSVAEAMLKDTVLLAWLLMRVSQKESTENAVSFPAVKLRASEILSSILQRDEARLHAADISKLDAPTTAAIDELIQSMPPPDGNGARSKKEGKVEGMECLLQSIAMYRKRDPRSVEECEFLENCLDALSASLLSLGNAEAFLEAEGVELMLRCIRERVHSGQGATKVLTFAMLGPSSSTTSLVGGDSKEGGKERKDPYVRACETFVEAGGLKLLFPMYMGRAASIPKPAKCSDAGRELTPPSSEENNNGGKAKGTKRAKKIKSARREWLRSLEGDALRVVYALTSNLDSSSPHDARSRLLSKFLENDHEKTDRTVELLLRYDGMARKAEYKYHISEEAEAAEEEGVDVDLAAMSAKLGGGGELCHRAAAVLGFACEGSKRCHEHVLDQLKAKNAGVGVIKSALGEFTSLLGDGHPQRDRLLSYLSTI